MYNKELKGKYPKTLFVNRNLHIEGTFYPSTLCFMNILQYLCNRFAKSFFWRNYEPHSRHRKQQC